MHGWGGGSILPYRISNGKVISMICRIFHQWDQCWTSNSNSSNWIKRGRTRPKIPPNGPRHCKDNKRPLKMVQKGPKRAQSPSIWAKRGQNLHRKTWNSRHNWSEQCDIKTFIKTLIVVIPKEEFSFGVTPDLKIYNLSKVSSTINHINLSCHHALKTEMEGITNHVHLFCFRKSQHHEVPNWHYYWHY